MNINRTRPRAIQLEGDTAAAARRAWEKVNAKMRREGYWTPAHAGTEKPFTTRTGARLLYCHNPVTGQHAYIDLTLDRVLTDAEARAALDLEG